MPISDGNFDGSFQWRTSDVLISDTMPIQTALWAHIGHFVQRVRFQSAPQKYCNIGRITFV